MSYGASFPESFRRAADYVGPFVAKHQLGRYGGIADVPRASRAYRGDAHDPKPT